MALWASSSLTVTAHNAPTSRPTACSVSFAGPTSSTSFELCKCLEASLQVSHKGSLDAVGVAATTRRFVARERDSSMSQTYISVLFQRPGSPFSGR